MANDISDISAEDLAGLSEEERKALEDEIEDEGGKEPAEGEAGPDEKAGEEPAEPPEEEVKPAIPPANEEPEGAQEEPQEPTKSFAYTAPQIEDYQEKVAAIAEEKAALRTRFRDGEITSDEYDDAREVLLAKELDLREAKTKADISAESQLQSAEASWQATQDAFFSSDPRLERYRSEVPMNAAFNAVLKQLADDNANADKSPTWYLREADRIIQESMGVAAPKPKPKERVPDMSKVPPVTLGDIPAAEHEAAAAAGEFAYLDKLTGMELEAAIAKMPEEQQERYLRE